MSPSAPSSRSASDSPREPWETDLLAFVRSLSQREADVVPFEIGDETLFLANSPVAAQHLLVARRSNYTSRPLPLATISSALTEPGAALLRHKLSGPAHATATSPDDTSAQLSRDLIAALRASGPDPVGLLGIFKTAFLGAVARQLFGFTPPPAETTAVAEAKATLERYRAYPLPPGTIPRDSAPGRKLQSAFATDRRFSRHLLAAAGHPLPAEAAPEIAFDDEAALPPEDQALATVSRVLMNGYNGPAIALTWLFHLLAEHPDAQAQVAAEAAAASRHGSLTFDALPALPYTRQVVQESLRLFPPAWLLSRQAVDTDMFGPVSIPPGATVLLSPFVLHRDARFWSDPDRFQPERFASKQGPPPIPGSYLPFGLGSSGCPASTFALKQLQFLVARLAQEFSWQAPSGASVQPWGLISLHPDPDVHVFLRNR